MVGKSCTRAPQLVINWYVFIALHIHFTFHFTNASSSLLGEQHKQWSWVPAWPPWSNAAIEDAPALLPLLPGVDHHLPGLSPPSPPHNFNRAFFRFGFRLPAAQEAAPELDRAPERLAGQLRGGLERQRGRVERGRFLLHLDQVSFFCYFVIGKQVEFLLLL